MAKTVVLTGGTSGIGKAIGEALAARGHSIILASRKQPSEDISFPHRFVHLDLISTDSVDACARALAALTSQIDYLILNSGMCFPPNAKPTANAAGIDRVFACNFVGHARLAHALLPLLEASPQPRILATSSSAHFLGSLSRLRQLPYLPNQNDYMDSKLAIHLFGLELTRREASHSNLKFLSINPGGVHTPLVAGMIGAVLPCCPQSCRCRPNDVQPATSAKVFLFALDLDLDASGRSYGHVAGSYYCARCGPFAACCECCQCLSWYPRDADESPYARDAETAAKLWEWVVEEGAPGPQSMKRD